MVWLLTIPSTLPKLNWKPFSTATTFTCTAGVEYCFLSFIVTICYLIINLFVLNHVGFVLMNTNKHSHYFFFLYFTFFVLLYFVHISTQLPNIQSYTQISNVSNHVSIHCKDTTFFEHTNYFSHFFQIIIFTCYQPILFPTSSMRFAVHPVALEQ